MKNQKETRSYLDWTPAVEARENFQGAVSFTYLQTDLAGNAYWVEQRPSDEGRSVLVVAGADGRIKDLTPKPYSVRSRVFEYGSYPYAVSNGTVYFVNFTDQVIYKQDLSHPDEIIALTVSLNADGSLGKYADLTVSADGRWLAFAYEKETKSGEYPNFVGILDLHKSGLQEARILLHGASFYRSPLFSATGRSLAWLEWNHPHMSWDSTYLFTAPVIDGKIETAQKRKIAGSEHSSISSFTYAKNDALYYAIDFAGEAENSPLNFYNVHEFKDGKDRIITRERADYLALRMSDENLICLKTVESANKISSLNPVTLEAQSLALPYGDVGAPVAAPNGNIFFVGSPDNRPAEMVKAGTSGQIQVLRKSSQFAANPDDVSVSELVKFPTEDGKFAYGYFYPPANSRYQAPPSERPPVRVLIHGGPVAMTTSNFTLSKMFWTSQGYAIFDVNYRGSFGFGRAYRDAIKHKWGLIEIADVKDGLTELKKQGKISDQAVVSGGSAGGYTVQRLLTSYPDLFAAGASLFGIGNLVTLQKLTHKFESHYLEQLIGGTLTTNLKEYEERSPINHLEKLKAPMIIFQGSDDKVVPAENSREMAEILKKKGIEYEYYEYPGEGHGFRKKENLLGSLEKEAAFFKRVLKRKQKP